MRIHLDRTAEELAERLLALWAVPEEDPFAQSLLISPGIGMQRWLSQRMATAVGITAGVVFTGWRGLERRLLPEDDPWRPDRLAWLIRSIAGRPGAEPCLLGSALGAGGATVTARRVATLLDSYRRHRPQLLTAWLLGSDLDVWDRPLGVERWQADLWRRLVDEIGEDPVERDRAIRESARTKGIPELSRRIAVVAPTRLDPSRVELLEALGHHHQVDLLVLRRAGLPGAAPTTAPGGHPLRQQLGGLADHTAALLGLSSALRRDDSTGDDLLGRLHRGLGEDSLPIRTFPLSAGDRSVEFHLCHGIERQVGVLRDVLTGIFAADDTLEPRDVVVITPRIAEVAPLAQAAFTATSAQQPLPFHQLRVRVADRPMSSANPLVAILLDLVALPGTRYEASRLLELCERPSIARRFGFTGDRLTQLSRLVERAGIKWGLSGPQRRAAGLPGLDQNTWLAGAQRMLLGVALSETDLVSAGGVLPLDDISSSDLELLGGLTEFLGRLSNTATDFARPRPLADWLRQCRALLERFTDPDPDEERHLGDVWEGLSHLAEESGQGSEVEITRTELVELLQRQFGDALARFGFGDGSLIICGPDSARQVPHRVVVLLGWDESHYPRRPVSGGDDLLADLPGGSGPDSIAEDRQRLLDAIDAAGERLVIIADGASATTGEPVPLASPLQDLMAVIDLTATGPSNGQASEAVTHRHRIQPFDAAYFDPAGDLPLSADPLGLVAARAQIGHRLPAPDRYRVSDLEPPDLSAGIGLRELSDFFKNPARAFLKQRLGLGSSAPAGDPDRMPLTLDALQRWKIGDRMVTLQRRGHPAEDVLAAEAIRGQTPPGGLGRGALLDLSRQAQATLTRIPSSGETAHHDLSVTVMAAGSTPITVSGRVTTTGSAVVFTEFANLGARHRLQAWLPLLLLAAAGEGQWQAEIAANNRLGRLPAPPLAESLALLGDLVSLYCLGMTRPLPAPPRVAERWARARATQQDPLSRNVRGDLTQQWNWESDRQAWKSFFPTFDSLLDASLDGIQLPGSVRGETSLLGALAVLVWDPLLKAEARR